MTHRYLRPALLAALLAVVLTGALASAARADHNDDFAAAVPLRYGVPDTTTIGPDDTTEVGESLTPDGAPDRNSCGGVSQAFRTLWWSVVGSGRPITVTTNGSQIDTHLGIFTGSVNDRARYCQDGNPNENFSFTSERGRTYLLQVGACFFNGDFANAEDPDGCGAQAGGVQIRVDSPAAGNDNRGAAQEIGAGTVTAGDNLAATNENGEHLDCKGRAFGRTVWYRWRTSVPGTVTVTAAGFVAAVYPASGGGPLDCEVNRTSVALGAGEYLIQVGGLRTPVPDTNVVDPDQGVFNVGLEFAENLDRDRDGANNANDCQPDNPAVHPGAPEVPQNGVDENCDRIDDPFPTVTSPVRASVVFYRTYTRLTGLFVERPTVGTRAVVTCRGAGCRRFRRHTALITRAARRVQVAPRSLRRARLRRGARIEVRLSLAGHCDRVAAFRVTKLRRRLSLREQPGAPRTLRTARCAPLR